MSLDLGRIFLELVAAMLIQFTPVEECLANNGTCTWGDDESRWYCLEATRPDTATVLVRIVRYDGETRSADAITLRARMAENDRFVWNGITGIGRTVMKAIDPPLPSARQGAPVPQKFLPNIWENSTISWSLVRTHAPSTNNTVPMHEYAKDDFRVGIMPGDGILRGFVLALDGKKPDFAEHTVRLADPDRQ